MSKDHQLQKDVMAELEYEPSLVAEHIAVTVDGGVVSLQGQVPSFAEKYAAEQAAFRVAGVKAVVEDLEVKLPGLNQRKDEEIAKAAADALTWNVLIPPASIHILVENGKVHLRGEVDWAYQRKAAERAVRYLTGVVAVVNEVHIRPRIQPHDVKSRIEKALVRSAEIDAKRVNVELRDSKVVLNGTVRSLAEANDVEWAAWAVPGVMHVESHLVVDPNQPAS